MSESNTNKMTVQKDCKELEVSAIAGSSAGGERQH